MAMSTRTRHLFLRYRLLFLFNDVKLTHQPNLTNETITLLAPENFPSHTDYSIVRPSCQLASQLLQSAPRFLVTMTEGDLHLSKESDSKGRKVNWAELDAMRDKDGRPYLPNFARYPTPQHDRAEESFFTKRASWILDHLSGMLVFETHQPLPSGVRGMTQRLPGPLEPALAKAFPRGVRSRIAVSRKLYDELSDRTKAAQVRNRPSRSLLILQFQLAKLLLHELGHALSNAVQGNTSYGESFHRDCDLAEMGYALENAVFGGVLDMNTTLCAANLDLCVNARRELPQLMSQANFALHAWPDGKTQYHYEKLGNRLFRSKRKMPPVTKVQRVDMKFLTALFSDGFWCQEHVFEPLALPVKGTWYEQIDKNSSTEHIEEVACEISDLADVEYPKRELQEIVAREIASGTRSPFPSNSTAIFELPVPLSPSHRAIAYMANKPLPTLPINRVAAQMDLPGPTSYKILEQDGSIQAGQLHESMKIVPIAALHLERETGSKRSTSNTVLNMNVSDISVTFMVPEGSINYNQLVNFGNVLPGD
ncbi:Hypothetical predicted protein [Lecanosticta acicola]|uniref:Uncharacterized protein n=1 Tax=Lecanosticta acicola TaxID=111012 RepID=A0AAI8Z109_9PEZI|nr:Hypothetical predicted protein [Lecanosticta acicola]